MSKKCDECKKDICDCRLSVKHYNRGYEHGSLDRIEKTKQWCSEALASDELPTEQKQGIALCLSWLNAEQIKEQKNE